MLPWGRVTFFFSTHSPFSALHFFNFDCKYRVDVNSELQPSINDVFLTLLTFSAYLFYSFVYILFKFAACSSEYIASNARMISK
jgi:hypothetical protein